MKTKSVYNIAIIRDGKSEYLDSYTDRFLKNLISLAEGNFEIKIYNDSNANWKKKNAKKYLLKDIKNDNVDLIFTNGLISSQPVIRLKPQEIIKPIVVGAIQLVKNNLFPISSKETSLYENLTFSSSPERVYRDLEFLSKVANEQTLFVLVDDTIIQNGYEIEETSKKFEEVLGIKVQLIGISTSAKEALSQLPHNAKAVYVGIPIQMSKDQKKELYAGLNKRDIVTLSMIGEQDLFLGAFATLAANFMEAAAKRAALNAFQMLSGVSAKELPVFLPVEDQLIVNFETAQKIDFFLDYDTALRAKIINVRDNHDTPKLTFDGAMRRAVLNSPRLQSSSLDVVVSKAEIGIEKSRLFPQISTFGRYNRSDYSDVQVIDMGGFRTTTNNDDTRFGEYGLAINQVLYNDELISKFRSSKREYDAAKFDKESVRLDTLSSAALEFLNLLINIVDYEVEKENLKLTYNNLELAKVRSKIGSTDNQEVYRFESLLSQQKSSVFQAEAQVDIAQARLSKALGTSEVSRWDPVDIKLKKNEFYFLESILDLSKRKIPKIRKLEKFFVQYAIANSPELDSFDKLQEAQGILLRQKERSYYVPIVSLVTEVNRSDSDRDVLGNNGQNEWFMGVEATFPILYGGLRKNQVLKQKASLDRLAKLRKEAEQLVEFNTKQAFNAYWSSQPRIGFSLQASKTAQLNYDSVKTKYAQGNVNVVDILDAQQNLLEQQRESRSAVYQHIIAGVQLQRALSWFDFEKTHEDKESFLRSIKEYLK